MQPHLNGALTGDAHTRFTAVATLLCLIDPVRGVAMVHGLDKHPHDTSWNRDHLQKKFLDSFAMICSTSAKGAETASAVCMEQDRPPGTVLRVARNCGVPPDVLVELRSILDDLTAVANQDLTAKEIEKDIAYKIVRITQGKFRSLFQTLSRGENRITVERAIEAMKADYAFQSDICGTEFESWVKILPDIVAVPPDVELEKLVPYAQWASQAKWVHSASVERLFELTEDETPKLVQTIYKIGRYFAATKNMLKLAKKQPGLFSSIHIKVVDAPATLPFSITDGQTTLATVLQRLTRGDETKYLQQLGKLWLTDNPERRFRQACHHKMVVHAEMQLLSFYDHHPDLTPRLLFMGTSKKACFLCYEFLSRNPLAMTVSASHQKLYPAWMPAPCTSSIVRKMYKEILWDMSRHLEKTAARDLDMRLGIRRPAAADSSGGPSLPTTESVA